MVTASGQGKFGDPQQQPKPGLQSWITAQYLTLCVHCGQEIERGSEAFPGKIRGYYHSKCALELHAAGLLDLTPPVCRHWGKGACRLGAQCFFRHEGPVEQHAGVNSSTSLLSLLGLPRARITNEATRKLNRGLGRRNKVRNDWRASAVRQWMINTWGKERLKQGTGVLDVGGGKGELSFELLNLNNIPSSVVDPRPLDLARAARFLRVGIYHQSVAYQDVNYDDEAVVPDCLPTHKHKAASSRTLPPQLASNTAAAGVSSSQHAAAPPAGPDVWLLGSPHRTPGHLQIMLSPAVVQAAVAYQHCIMAHVSASSNTTHPLSLSGTTTSAGLLQPCPACGLPVGLHVSHLLAVRRSLQSAAQIRWTDKGLKQLEQAHAEQPATEAAEAEQGHEVLPAQHDDAAELEMCSFDEPQQDIAALPCERCGACADANVGAAPSSWDMELRALHTLVHCSLVVALHADQATEHALDLAMALGNACLYPLSWLLRLHSHRAALTTAQGERLARFELGHTDV